MWKERNSFLWQGKTLKPTKLICQAISWMKEFQHWHRKNEKCNCKCNFDAAWDENRSIGGVGVVIRNDRGDFVAALAKRHDAIPSPLLAETMAARDAAWLVKEKQLLAFVFEGDALLVMVALQHDHQ
ncbi:hypothetical protein D8674_029011 [Pyrus ussuriensis x Pyrus communis]|uniref:RNase H type-1 domain-containing protein n=1 Tax=Pyrus ussuriensis x Pyrus communis TaxID=2448454 RepID=A0A5N5IBD8_9ROSA|nr:hypothetical protein D8674_029011 [Pyrus ussuriensis x Pyrus communis]